jgi:hypothetical protein
MDELKEKIVEEINSILDTYSARVIDIVPETEGELNGLVLFDFIIEEASNDPRVIERLRSFVMEWMAEEADRQELFIEDLLALDE